MLYRTDLHIHSCLSPCASLEMAPAAIVQRAKQVGLNAIALTDHNCTFNLPAFSVICKREGMACLYGMEVTTVEEAHVLCLFEDLETAMKMGQQVYASLPDVQNQPDRFGDQPIIDEHEEILGFAEKFLISASAYDVSSLVKEIHSLGGLIMPAHIDRAVFCIIAQLGFLPDEPFDAVELTALGRPELAQHYSVVRNSDSHDLSAIGSSFTELELESFTMKEIQKALTQAS